MRPPLLAGLLATVAGAGVANLTGAMGTVLRALVALGIFGVTYLLLTRMLGHPDAIRLWPPRR